MNKSVSHTLRHSNRYRFVKERTSSQVMEFVGELLGIFPHGTDLCVQLLGWIGLDFRERIDE